MSRAAGRARRAPGRPRQAGRQAFGSGTARKVGSAASTAKDPSRWRGGRWVLRATAPA